MNGTVCLTLIFKTFAAEIFVKVADLGGYNPVEVVAETVMNAVIVAKFALTLWHSSANPCLTISVVIVTAIVEGFSFLENNVRSLFLDIFIIVVPVAITVF